MSKKIKIQDINTSEYNEGEIILRGKAYSTNWYEKDVTIVMNAHEALEWMNTLNIKDRQRKYINKILEV